LATSPTTFYAATKQAVESIGLNYAKWCGMEFAGLRYGAVFGPWSGAGGGGPSNIIRQAMRKCPIPANGGPNRERAARRLISDIPVARLMTQEVTEVLEQRRHII
jgi:nucleoside-diphosphate-sugar epimerase